MTTEPAAHRPSARRPSADLPFVPRRRLRWLLAGLVVLVVLAGGCVDPPPQAIDPPEDAADTYDELPEPVEVATPAAESVARQAQAVTVRIRSLGCDQLGLGSGFVLPGGVVVTNRHVLDLPLQVTVSTWDGHRLDAQVTGVANDSDLALLELADADGLPTAELRHRPLEDGEVVHAVGYPGGGAVTITEGEVVGRASGELLGEPSDVIRVDADIRQGNSGGPLFDEDGQVVGVIFAIETGANTGLAVPIDTLLARLEGQNLDPPQRC